MEATNSSEQQSARSAEEMRKLCEDTEDLIFKVLGHLRSSGVTADADELAAFGRQGLVEAAARFDPNRGEDFRRFAYFRVKGAMLDGIRKMGTWSRRGYERIALLRAAHVASSDQADEAGPVGALGAREAAERLQKHMASMVTAMTTGVFGQPAHQGDGEVQAVHAGSDAEQQLADKQMTELVRRAIDELPPPEDMVVRRFYVDGDKMDDIAEDLGHSRSWVSRVHTRALKRLGARLRTITP